MKDAATPSLALEPPMLALDPSQLVYEPASPAIAGPSLAAARAADGGFDAPPTLPRDHPAWQRDVLAVSARVRAILGRMRPVAIRVLTFWDHVVRRVSVGGRHLEVDPSGCYRVR
ncbi:MAG: hypothetical protein JWM87_4602 [Candidatus Eremiobacteraeota bacterium]|nr:hypothetical protein [Candidatus Eremiobacteraeota bacterium]